MSIKHLILIGFLTFALFVGAGNIIFPPFIGLEAGGKMWSAAFGFLSTGVGLPILALIAMARTQGSFTELTKPAGKFLGSALIIVCYLAIGPLFGTPRTAAVSYEIGIAPILNAHFSLLIFSLIFFALVIICALNPSKLIEIISNFLSPLKVIALALLGLYAFLRPAGSQLVTSQDYLHSAFPKGLVNGYATMDTLAALVFSTIILNAIKQKGVTERSAITKYTILASLIAGFGLIYIYISLFYLGAHNVSLTPNATNGAQILQAYIANAFGPQGSYILAFIITIACLVTAIGLTNACAEFFSDLLKIPYKIMVLLLGIFSFLCANMGLTQIIGVSVPVLSSIYPPFIILVLASILLPHGKAPISVMLPTLLVALFFGIIQSFMPQYSLPLFLKNIPFASHGMMWLLPSCLIFIFCYGVFLLQKKHIKKA